MSAPHSLKGHSIADEPEFLPGVVPPFTIRDFRRVEYGSKRAEFTVALPGLEVETDLFIPDSRPAFSTPASVRNQYDGGAWTRKARFERPLAEAITEAALRIYEPNADATTL